MRMADLADGQPLPVWHPGAHFDISLPSGRVRQYSLCGDPADHGSYRIAVRRIPTGGGGSIEIHDDLRVGSTVHAMRFRWPFLDEVARFGDRIEIRTDDKHGVPTAAQLLGECPDGTTVYACGPAPMLTLIRDRLQGVLDALVLDL